MRLVARMRRLGAQGGYTLVEMLTVLLILGVVMGGLTTVLASATNADSDMNNRFQAQQATRLALDKLRREIHCSSSATPAATSTSSITLTLPTYCKTYSGSVSVTWCTRSVSTNRYALYRVNGSTCTGTVSVPARSKISVMGNFSPAFSGCLRSSSIR